MKLAISTILLCSTALACWAGMGPQTNLVGMEKAILDASNLARQENGLLPLVGTEKLATAARNHSGEMMEKGYFAHSSPTPQLATVVKRLRKVQCASLTTGENLYRCTGAEAREVAALTVHSWMKSPPHRANLLNPKFNRMGVGVVGQGNAFVVTQDFALETVEVNLKSVVVQPEGLVVNLDCKVQEGARDGAVFYQGKRVDNWKADQDGAFQLEQKIPQGGLLELGQTLSEGEWLIETQLDVKPPGPTDLTDLTDLGGIALLSESR